MPQPRRKATTPQTTAKKAAMRAIADATKVIADAEKGETVPTPPAEPQDTTPEFVKALHEQIRSRMEELQPAVEEYHALELVEGIWSGAIKPPAKRGRPRGS